MTMPAAMSSIPSAAEQVHRPLAEAADEQDREQVEEAAHVALEAVLAAARRPRGRWLTASSLTRKPSLAASTGM